jgi:integrase
MAILKIQRQKGIVYKVVLPKKAGRKRLTRSCTTMSEAKQWEAKFKLMNLAHHQPSEPLSEKITLGEAIQEWISSNHNSWESGTLQYYQQKTANLKGLYDVKLSRLSAFLIDEWLIYQKKYSPTIQKRSGFQKEIKVLRTALTWFKEYRDPDYAPPVLRRHHKDACLGKKPTRVTESDLAYDSLIFKFIESFKEHKNPLYYVLASTMYYTGMRIGEAAALDVHTSIDLDKRRIHVDSIVDWHYTTRRGVIKMQTKTKLDRYVLIPDPLVGMFQWWIAEKREPIGSLVFHRQGKPLSYSTIQSVIYRAKEKTGLKVPGCTHFLRHAFATHFAKVTGDTRATSCGLGHQSTDMTNHYVHLDQQNYESKWETFNKNVPVLSLIKTG